MADNQIKLWPDWKIIKEIGAGSFGKVYEIHRQNGVHLEKAALKVIRIPSSPADLLQLRAEGLQAERTEEYLARHVDEIRNEIGVMQKFVGYSNIVSYEDYLINKHQYDVGWDILIRMELLTDMSDYMTKHPMTEKLVLKMGMDISQALVILHGAGIIHRDIKPQNIFINDRGFFKIGDFGISRALPQTGGVMSFKGTVSYMAPETFAMRGTDARSDIYSLALVLHRCLNGGREPLLTSSSFTPMQKEEAQHRRLMGQKLPAPAYGSRAIAGVLAIALDPDPSKRYQTAAQFYQALAGVASGIPGTEGPVPKRTASPSRGIQSTDFGEPPLQGKNPVPVHGTGRNSVRGNGRTDRSGLLSVKRQAGKRLTEVDSAARKKRILAACGAACAGLLIGAAVLMTMGKSSGIQPSSSVQAVDQTLSSPADIKNNVAISRAKSAEPEPVLYTGEDAGNAVIFADQALENAVRKEMGLTDGPVTIADAVNVFQLDLSGSLKAEDEKITDLTGLEAFENLEELNLSGNKISDIEELGELRNLDSLDLGENRITDLSPLSSMNSLKYLDLMDNEIDTTEPISRLFSLELLDMSGNLLGDIDGLENLSSLNFLILDRNEIEDLDPLSSLTELIYLSVSENRIESLKALKGKNLYGLFADNNQIENIEPLSGMNSLERLWLHNNQIRDISVVTELTGLTELSVFGNPIEDSTPLEKIPDSVNLYAD